MTQDRVHEESFIRDIISSRILLAVSEETATSAVEMLSKAKLIT
jgi:hypothetical protein